MCLRAGVNDAKAHELYGTGFVVDNGSYIITALHVVKKHKSIKISLPNNKGWEIVVLVDSDNNIDVALLKSKIRRPPIALENWADVMPGSDVFVIGYPEPLLLGFAPKITAGMFNGERELNGVSNVFQMSAQIQNGSSGSPVINCKGNVVGMFKFRADSDLWHQKRQEAPQNINLALKSSLLRQFLVHSLGVTESLPHFQRQCVRADRIFEPYLASVVVVNNDH